MKKNFGFSLIEVMIALVVAALIITPLTRLVMRAVTSISERSSQLENYMKLQSFLYESRLYDKTEQNFSREEVITPRKTIRYTRSALSEKSSLQVPFLTKEVVIFEDKDVPENRQDKLISFLTILPPEKKNGEKATTQQPKTEKETSKQMPEVPGESE